jgi:hypothetical protein
MTPRLTGFDHVRVCQENGVTQLVENYFRPVESRPSKVMSKAFNAGFQRIVQRRRALTGRIQAHHREVDTFQGGFYRWLRISAWISLPGIVS